MNKDQEKKLAFERIELFRRRYKQFSGDYFPLVAAQRWAALFDAPKPDLDQMKNLVQESLLRKNDYDLSYFTFCNYMDQTFQQCQQDFYGRQN